MVKLNENDWFFIVRTDTNERLLNKSGDINICREHHLQGILRHLNRFANVWEAITIAEYKEIFGEYMNINTNLCEYESEEVC